jgi:hypothetical protein
MLTALTMERTVAIQSFPTDDGSYSTPTPGPSSAYLMSVIAARTALQARLTMCGKHLNQEKISNGLTIQIISPNPILFGIEFDFSPLEGTFQCIHHGVIVGCIITCNPSKLLCEQWNI